MKENSGRITFLFEIEKKCHFDIQFDDLERLLLSETDNF
jgi:hypothetical protein